MKKHIYHHNLDPLMENTWTLAKNTRYCPIRNISTAKKHYAINAREGERLMQMHDNEFGTLYIRHCNRWKKIWPVSIHDIGLDPQQAFHRKIRYKPNHVPNPPQPKK